MKKIKNLDITLAIKILNELESDDDPIIWKGHNITPQDLKNYYAGDTKASTIKIAFYLKGSMIRGSLYTMVKARILSQEKLIASTKQKQKKSNAQSTLEEFQVTMAVPLKVIIKMPQNVMAMDKVDAIKQLQIMNNIIPKEILLDKLKSNIFNYSTDIKFDDPFECVYDAIKFNDIKKG